MESIYLDDESIAGSQWQWICDRGGDGAGRGLGTEGKKEREREREREREGEKNGKKERKGEKKKASERCSTRMRPLRGLTSYWFSFLSGTLFIDASNIYAAFRVTNGGPLSHCTVALFIGH